MEDWSATRHTLRLLKYTLLNTSSQSLVEKRVEHVVRNAQLVVGADIFLELLTAVKWLACWAIHDDAHT